MTAVNVYGKAAFKRDTVYLYIHVQLLGVKRILCNKNFLDNLRYKQTVTLFSPVSLRP